mgnify:CR=1 FL=1
MFCDGPEAVNQHTKNPWDETTWAESVRFGPKCSINGTFSGLARPCASTHCPRQKVGRVSKNQRLARAEKFTQKQILIALKLQRGWRPPRRKKCIKAVFRPTKPPRGIAAVIHSTAKHEAVGGPGRIDDTPQVHGREPLHRLANNASTRRSRTLRASALHAVRLCTIHSLGKRLANRAGQPSILGTRFETCQYSSTLKTSPSTKVRQLTCA